MYLIPCMLCHVLLCTSTLALDVHHRREREMHFCLLADLRTLLWLPSFSFLCTLASLSSTSFWRIFLSLLDAPRCCNFFTFLREEPLWMWPSSRIVQNSFQRIKQKVKEFKEATDKTLVWANTMTAMLSKKLWSAMFNVYSSFAYARLNLPPRLVSENQKGRLKNNPEAIIEVCTLLYPVSKMIIIEIQISIQRSIQMGNKLIRGVPYCLLFSTTGTHHPLASWQLPGASPLASWHPFNRTTCTATDWIHSYGLSQPNTDKKYQHQILYPYHYGCQIPNSMQNMLPANTGWSKAMNLLLV